VKRLIQLVQEESSTAEAGTSSAANAERAAILEALTKAYVDAALDETTRIELIKFLADTRDTRTRAAWIKACSGFAEGKGQSEEDVKWAAGAMAATKLEDGVAALGQAFLKLQAGSLQGARASKNVHDAMVSLASPSWKDLILDRLSRRLIRPSGAGDATAVAGYQNELFWQTTAVDLAGELRDVTTVKPLFKVVMAPSKSDLAPAAVLALTRIGKDAMPVLLGALAGKDPELVEYARSNSGGSPDDTKSCVRAAALVLGAIGRADATDPMLQALEAADSDATRAVIARELTRLPAEPRVVNAFQAAYDKIDQTTVAPPLGQNARSRLLESAANFFDPSMISWLLKEMNDRKGDRNKVAVNTAGLMSVIKLMTKAQIAVVKSAVAKYGSRAEEDAFEVARDVVNACADDVECYVSRLIVPAAEEQDTRFIGVKAAYMLGIFGRADTSMQIVKQLSMVKSAVIRASAALAIDHLTRSDPAPIAEALQRIVDQSKGKEKRNIVDPDAPLVEAIYRLRVR